MANGLNSYKVCPGSAVLWNQLSSHMLKCPSSSLLKSIFYSTILVTVYGKIGKMSGIISFRYKLSVKERTMPSLRHTMQSAFLGLLFLVSSAHACTTAYSSYLYFTNKSTTQSLAIQKIYVARGSSHVKKKGWASIHKV